MTPLSARDKHLTMRGTLFSLTQVPAPFSGGNHCKHSVSQILKIAKNCRTYFASLLCASEHASAVHHYFHDRASSKSRTGPSRLLSLIYLYVNKHYLLVREQRVLIFENVYMEKKKDIK